MGPPVDSFKELALFCLELLVVGEVSISARTKEGTLGLFEQ
ncbi:MULTISPECIES: hypothetical protein [Pyrobaculum]|nr:hypothetical protein [Pyrobaculum arsenaticum]